MASVGNRIVKNTLFLYGKMGITMFISLYTTRLILGSLGSSDYGIFNIVGGAIAMLGFLNASMSSATQRFMSYAEGGGNELEKKKIFNSTIVLHFGFSLAIGLLLELAAFIFFGGILDVPEERIHAARFIYHCSVLATMFSVQAVPFEAVINAHENMLYYSVVGILESVMKLAVAFVVVYWIGDKLIIYGILMALISLIMRIIMGTYCRKHYEECVLNFRKFLDKVLVKNMGTFAFWNMTSAASSMLTQYGMGVVLNHFFGTIVNAAQGITNQISGQFGSLSGHATKALNPVIVKSAGAHNPAMMHKSVLWGNKVIFFLSSVIFLAILSNLDPFLSIWLKDVPDYTHIFVTLYLIVNMVNVLGTCFGTAISANGRIKQYQLCSSLVSFIPFVFGIVVFSLGFPAYFIYVLMIFSTSITTFLKCFFAHELCGFSWKDILMNDILRCITAFLLSIFIALSLSRIFPYAYNVFGLVAISLIEIAIYTALFYMIAFDRDDRHYLIAKALELKRKIIRTC